MEACNGYLNFLKILNKFVCTIIDIPNNVRIDKINIKHLPKGWGDYPHLPETRDLGSKFLEKNENLLLAVPSSIFPEGSYNYIINPRHTDLKRIKVSNLKDFNFRPCPR